MDTPTPNRLANLAIAAELGASEELLETLRTARYVSKKATVLLPQGRFERLSQGKGWARQGSGATAVWGAREDGGYRVGPGRWVVGSNDGFKRREETTYTVKHVTVGDQVWTVAT